MADRNLRSRARQRVEEDLEPLPIEGCLESVTEPDLPQSIWILIFAFRVNNALSTATFFQPDEFYQSLEVAHRFVFGYGYLTWEWKERIRSFAHPAIYAFAFYVVDVLGLASWGSSLVGLSKLELFFAF
jgi:hypothetical protein